MMEHTTNPTNNNAALNRLLPLLRELAESVNQNIYMGMEGTGEMSAGLYRALHAKVIRLLPDDEYITSALVLKYPKSIKDEDLLGVVNLAVRQLVTYIQIELGIDDQDDDDEDDRREKRRLRKVIIDEEEEED